MSRDMSNMPNFLVGRNSSATAVRLVVGGRRESDGLPGAFRSVDVGASGVVRVGIV